MTPDERQLITGLFDRMRAFALAQKDREAEALINQAVRAQPDAPYMLVQSVLVQEQALEAANARIQDLEERVRDLEQGTQPQQGGGSFLGGLFGSGTRPDPERRASSVPAIGSRAGSLPSVPQSRAQAAPEMQQPAGGGFMRSAMTTAAGVAGGMLLAEGIRNMLGGNSAHATPSTAANDAEKQKAQDVADDERQDAEEDAAYDPSQNDVPDWGGDLDI